MAVRDAVYNVRNSCSHSVNSFIARSRSSGSGEMTMPGFVWIAGFLQEVCCLHPLPVRWGLLRRPGRPIERTHHPSAWASAELNFFCSVGHRLRRQLLLGFPQPRGKSCQCPCKVHAHAHVNYALLANACPCMVLLLNCLMGTKH